MQIYYYWRFKKIQKAKKRLKLEKNDLKNSELYSRIVKIKV